MIVQLSDSLYQGDWASVFRREYKEHKIGAMVRVSKLLAPGMALLGDAGPAEELLSSIASLKGSLGSLRMLGGPS